MGRREFGHRGPDPVLVTRRLEVICDEISTMAHSGGIESAAGTVVTGAGGEFRR
ncbi:hypothetical protein [Gordonia hongkongensis]|uniref:hypothetical protein n=1 Tax=Gordonia hongkongensis TaxID=1701090 RepID=UPI003D762E64